MMTTKEEATAKIDYYNQEIDRLLRERKALMDELMPLFADAQVGNTIYTSDGRYLGIVKRHYRFHANRNPLEDTSMDIHYEFYQPSSPYSFDNTSRYGYEIGGVVTEAEHKRSQLEAAKRLLAQSKHPSES